MGTDSTESNDHSDHHGLAHELADALALDQFFLVYQPTIDLQTNAFAGVEALIRWRHPERGVLTPDAFIDELEADGQILPVGRWALRTACAQGAAWHDKGYRFAVSVNVSQRQMESDTLRDDVADALSSSRFDPALLVLEFAQGTLLNNEGTSSIRVKQLKTLGVRLAVDDFEPGESALDELEKFEVDIVKLDREFIAAISTSSAAASLVHGLVKVSDTRHVQVIAAGIEDSDQRERLANERVHVGQGFLFSEPHEADEIDRYLEDFAIFSGKPL
jgi:EAL domain-containing protein (putative c-di-GMP-specific phosphodiesterase class I)